MSLASFSDLDPKIVRAHAEVGMLTSLFARHDPDRIAVHSQRGNRTIGQLNANANRLVNALAAAGVGKGDHLAILCPSVPEFVEVFAATLRSGLRFIPINWHLKPDEVDYIVGNSDAKVLIGHVQFAEQLEKAGRQKALKVKLAIGGDIPGFDSYDTRLAGSSDADPPAPSHGLVMHYTSGTTGQPKGVYRERPRSRMPTWGPQSRDAFVPEGDVVLCCGPTYHASPLTNTIWRPLVSGAPTVLMEKFDAENVLRTIQDYRVTHATMVAVMFQRLLALPEAVRKSFDLSSLRRVHHGAAPTPPEVKRAMIDWLGPIIDEAYGATEGPGGYFIDTEEWLRKPGSVGRMLPDWGGRIMTDAGEPAKPGEVGEIQFRIDPESPFSYYKDPEKTASTRRGDSHYTVGDYGYVDEDGYLFITGRSAETIISGGVNIYPQEIDNALGQHPAVRMTCVVGVPSEAWGEEVKAVIALNDGFEASPELGRELIESIRPVLASYKLPRSVDFVADIPTSEAGKILRKQVRDSYWAGRERQV